MQTASGCHAQFQQSDSLKTTSARLLSRADTRPARLHIVQNRAKLSLLEKGRRVNLTSLFNCASLKQSVLALGLLALGLSIGCSKKAENGFQIAGSPLRFEYVDFNDPSILTELNGQKITRSQILDKSVVLKDLERQENDALIGLTYRLMAEKLGEKRGVIEVALPKSETKLEQILSRFGWLPVPGLTISFVKQDPSDKMVGRMGQVIVSRDELPNEHAVLYSIALRKHHEITSQLSSQIARISLHGKAIEANKPLQDYINEVVLDGKPIEVSDAELAAYLKKIGFAESELTPALREQFIVGIKEREQQLRIEEYVAKKLLKEPLKVSFRPPVFQLRLPEDWKPNLGVKDAPVSIIAISSSTCPDCQSFAKMVQDLAKKFSGNVQLYWLNDFDDNDGIARMVAEGAICVEAQKRGKSIEFFQNFIPVAMQSDEKSFYEWADKHGLDRAKYEACFKGQESAKLLDKQRGLPRKLGIVTRPSLWVSGELVENTSRVDQVEGLVESLVEESGTNWFAKTIRRLKDYFDTRP